MGLVAAPAVIRALEKGMGEISAKRRLLQPLGGGLSRKFEKNNTKNPHLCGKSKELQLESAKTISC